MYIIKYTCISITHTRACLTCELLSLKIKTRNVRGGATAPWLLYIGAVYIVSKKILFTVKSNHCTLRI